MATVRIAAVVHFALPYRCAGSEVVLHELLKHAANTGHEVTCYVTDCGMGPPETYDGVRVVRVRNVVQGARMAAAQRPTVLVSQHQHAMHTIRTAKLVHAQSVFLIHNDMDVNQRPLALGPDLVVFNSAWVEKSLARFTTPKESLTFHPPLTPDRHKVHTTGDAVTLVNVNEHKGARIFARLAALNPDRKFLAVVGGHGVQIRNYPNNVELVEHTPDMRTVWARTRVLLMPSIYESYGLVAMEAALNGIPTIANGTPGLRENLGMGGVFVDWLDNLPTPPEGVAHWEHRPWFTEWANPSPDHVRAWSEALAELDDPDTYTEASAYARHRADSAEQETRDTLTMWADWLTSVVPST